MWTNRPMLRRQRSMCVLGVAGFCLTAAYRNTSLAADDLISSTRLRIVQCNNLVEFWVQSSSNPIWKPVEVSWITKILYYTAYLLTLGVAQPLLSLLWYKDLCSRPSVKHIVKFKAHTADAVILALTVKALDFMSFGILSWTGESNRIIQHFIQSQVIITQPQFVV